MAASPYSNRDVVDTYDRLALPYQFAAPARDLVDALGLRLGECLLDIGTGTGGLAVHAATAVGSAGTIVGLDSSLEMLRRFTSKRIGLAVQGVVPGLPFRDACFDAVSASFVLSHLQDYPGALRDMVRVLRPSGRLGATGWGRTPTSVSQLWTEVISERIDLHALKQSFQRLIPSEDEFSDEAGFRAALSNAGLLDVTVARREYPTTIDTDQYVTLKQFSVEGTLLRQQLDTAQWTALRQRLIEAFRERLGGTVSYVRDAYVAIGTKPPSRGFTA